ncbi:MAG: ACP S-malonyltransferase [Candidatus Azobacteroides pseudotrichonymphae]|jgi:[acyl-carrier-protein] S-malonyltransferase|uniref:Malonyl CoA-acyl carrier protein transacylase n=1 Tax=Azobacteroides pseudotrichonymphae genomovar. CFP2 TaxID=511995 RepID=B6YS12_AZOPC|nr:ACP S-malonyltransferase [Candidatus Azobacteroides pseudotrichonymphae]MDR0530412.1 ACP S-malonyltransferase [Bacteroidales bacterium OttesenSCG-928-I14]BAG83984.1 malonyl CoA-acyl carrier protein transacylase [Candidatus Azobacteroides pseudotrichonymphae genomovar. CFP2]GMO33838.1 MAG: ACP S-malonyltransferase [Candidatus Azobacteroides pseudotrichonymphae]
MNAFIFPGQGVQFPGMGLNYYKKSVLAKELFETANEILGFRITDLMFRGTAEDLRQTKTAQPAIFLHSVIVAKSLDNFNPSMLAGHSLGEFSALVAATALSFKDGLLLVYKRALAMQKACEVNHGTMAAILGISETIVEEICSEIEGIVVPANYNCPGQIVISGDLESVSIACERLAARGAKCIRLNVAGAFHSPLMELAKAELAEAIHSTVFITPICPIYQNVNGKGETIPEIIKDNLVSQLTAPVRWTQSVQNMITDGATFFTEIGPGSILQGLIRKINCNVKVASIT